MGIIQSDREMIEQITTVGVRAAVLLKGVILEKVNRETLEWGLEELSAFELMNKYYSRLVDEPEYVHLTNLLHLVSSLESQLDYQVREYGLDSLKDDLQEINFSLQQVGKSFDLPSLKQAV
jgi:hypothetical protein